MWRIMWNCPTLPHQLSHYSLRYPSSPRFKLFSTGGKTYFPLHLTKMVNNFCKNILRLHDKYIQAYKRHNSKTQRRVKWRQWNSVPVLLVLPYSQIHMNCDEWISPISQSILNQFSLNFTHTIFHSCRDYPENFDKYLRSWNIWHVINKLKCCPL